MPNLSEERIFHVAIVWYVTIHVSSADVIRVAGRPCTLRCSVGWNVNLTTHARVVPVLRIHGLFPFTVYYSSISALGNSLYSGMLWSFPS